MFTHGCMQADSSSGGAKNDGHEIARHVSSG